MKKMIISLALLCSILPPQSIANEYDSAEIQPTAPKPESQIEVLSTMTEQSSAPNRIWVGTFQLVWNEIIENITKAPIKFIDFNSPIAEELNKKEFTNNDISELSYYVKSGTVSPLLKRRIEKDIKDKFFEKSDILDKFNWKYDPHKLFVYAMLKKDFKFLVPFEKLSEGPFGENYTPVKYFGTSKHSSKMLTQTINILFHNSNNDFAVKLYTKGKDIVLLYRTDDEKTFEEYFADINAKATAYSGSRTFTRQDKLRVPEINLYQEVSFPELEGHQIAGTNLQIEKTLETVDFKMDNVGVKLKSEAAATVETLSMREDLGRYFTFTDKFVLFLIEKNKNIPYYAMRINDIETINKTGK